MSVLSKRGSAPVCKMTKALRQNLLDSQYQGMSGSTGQTLTVSNHFTKTSKSNITSLCISLIQTRLVPGPLELTPPISRAKWPGQVSPGERLSMQGFSAQGLRQKGFRGTPLGGRGVHPSPHHHPPPSHLPLSFPFHSPFPLRPPPSPRSLTPFLLFPSLTFLSPSPHHHPSQPPLPPPVTTHHPNRPPKNNTTTLHPCPPFHPVCLHLSSSDAIY